MQTQYPEGVDLFEHYNLLTGPAAELYRRFCVDHPDNSDADAYQFCKIYEARFKAVGLTFDWGLDGQPYNLRPVGS